MAEATSEALKKVAEAITVPGGAESMNLKVAQQYIEEFGKLAQTNNTMIIPANLSDMGGMVAAVTEIIGQTSSRKSCGFGKGERQGAAKGATGFTLE